jgi:beta-galactosidase/beta-glucuronidase
MAYFGKTLNQTILVPFPVESCLSGVVNATLAAQTPPDFVAPTHTDMVYRTVIDGRVLQRDGPIQLLHFGAVDWQCEVYVNSIWVGSHEGGYDAFSLDITQPLRSGVGAGTALFPL